MSRLCSICARGGSKGVPNKHLREILGRPLLAHTVEQAKKSSLFDAVAVSSDSDAILQIAQRFGADVLVRRPDQMATDAAPKLPAIRHCLEFAERQLGTMFLVLVDLDATSPLRAQSDIAGAVRLLEERGVSNVITGAPARRSPYFNLVELDEQGIVHLSKTLDRPIERRQDSPRCFDMNGSIYVWQRDAFLKNPIIFYDDTLLFEMPPERSIDIDTELDFEIVRTLMTRAHTAA